MTMTGTKARGHERMKANRFRAGYSFTEVMFAVVVLGIGFIMIAAMFPVAISQSQATAQESTAASIARGAVNHIQAIATNMNMPHTDAVVAEPARTSGFTAIGTGAGPYAPATAGYWNAVKGNLLLQTDPRFAYVPFYRREQNSSFAQIIIVVTQCRARPTYDATDVTPTANANLQPRAIKVTITNDGGGTGVDWIAFATGDADKAGVAEGTYVVIDRDPGNGPAPVGSFNGRVYRVGIPATNLTTGAPEPDTWTLQPGNDFLPIVDPGNDKISGTADDENWFIGADADAFIIGRELTVSGTAATAGNPDSFRGIAQDVAVYTTYVQVRP
jgi:hypothetical protein